MRIGLDGRNLGLPQGTGVATYAAVLASCLPLAGLQPEVLTAAPLLSRPRRWAAAAWPGASNAVPTTPATRTAPDLFRVAQVHFDIWRQLRPVRGAAPPDIMHWTYPLPLRLVGRPNIYTIHDLIPLLHPALTGIDAPRMRRMLRAILRHAVHLVTVSEATRQDIITTLGVPPHCITNTGQAVDVTAADPAPPAGLTPGRYWLHVGAIEPRKNIPRLAAAWRASNSPHPLILAGPDGWLAAPQLHAAPGIRRIPFLPRPQLLALIRDARALLMPSLAEGFGLPVAEAMALGTPVLTSNHGALAEIAGPAGHLVDPLDTASITNGLQTIDADDGLRRHMAERGLHEAARFRREVYAEKLGAMYRALSGNPALI